LGKNSLMEPSDEEPDFQTVMALLKANGIITGAPKKRGRPLIDGTAKTAAERQRDRRAKLATGVQEKPFTEWTEAECLAVLVGRQWRGSEMDEAAWYRLGVLRGFS
jgi:hypothetical protein